MNENINWKRIYRHTGLSQQQLDQMVIDQPMLTDIYYDFKQVFDEYTSLAVYFVTQTLKFPRVHSARYRVKDPEHLIAKIIRKQFEDPERKIDATNYRSEITDLVGIRILHLFKRDYRVIDKRIKRHFKISEVELPTIYYRDGDDISSFDDKLFQIKKHKRGYRSTHYIIESAPNKNTIYIELQVRTIFEEGWSEIDHKLLYPDHLGDDLLNQFSLNLNSLAGSADSMATLMLALQERLDDTEFEHEIELDKKDKKIAELEDKINKSNLSKADKSEIITAFETGTSHKNSSANKILVDWLTKQRAAERAKYGGT